MFKSIIIQRAIFAFLLSLFSGVAAFGQGTAFTYQGRLTDSGNPADGLFDMRFRLFDTLDVGTGTQIGVVTNSSVQVMNGAFSVQLDFAPCASCFDGSARFLEISIRPAGSADPYTVLSPRQPITPAPYALRALDATQLGGIAASGFIRNSASQQAGTDFNISGSGTVGGTLTGGVVNATTQYKLSGLRMLAASGPFSGTFSLAASNTFLGDRAGLNTTPSPISNSTDGKLNSFFGAAAGDDNTTGQLNSFVGALAGSANTTGFANSFFGVQAGASNNTGSNNTLVGRSANVGAGDLTNATAIGAFARVDQSNSLVLGGITGVNSGTSVNVGIGTTTPAERLHVVGNGLFTGNLTASGSISIAGLKTEVTATTPNVIGGFLFNTVTAGVRGAFIGGGGDFPFNNRVTDDFGVVGGGRDNLAGNNAGTNFDGGHATVGGGEANTASGAHATVAGGFANNATGTDATVGGGFGNTASGVHATVPGGSTNVAAGDDSFAAGRRAKANHQATFVWSDSTSADFASTANDQFLIRASGGVGIGTTQPSASLHVSRDTSSITTPVAILESAGTQAPLAFKVDGPEVARIRADNLGNLVLATLAGTSKNIFFRAGDDSGTDLIIQSATGNVGIGDSTPVDRLDVEGDIRVGTGMTGCVKDADGNVIAGTCSSDARLKHSVTPFPETLDKLIKLRPVHFYWRRDEYRDKAFGAGQSFGLIAQEVEQIMPELVTQDEQGLKAVRYNKLPLLMLQAIKELKAENDSLKQRLDEMSREREQIKKQQTRIESLTKIICLAHPDADICR
jgi:hypothetical protein